MRRSALTAVTTASAFLSTALAAGCVSLSTFQSPEVLEQRTLVAGTGVTLVKSDDAVGAVPEIYARYGLSSRLEAGAKFVGIPPLGFLAADAKVQLLRRPLAVALDLGASYAAFPDEDDDVAFLALYPALLAGTRRLYGGAKLIHVVAGRVEDDELEAQTVPGLFAGTTLGGRLRLRPEIHLYLGEEDDRRELFPLAGLAVEWEVRPRR